MVLSHDRLMELTQQLDIPQVIEDFVTPKTITSSGSDWRSRTARARQQSVAPHEMITPVLEEKIGLPATEYLTTPHIEEITTTEETQIKLNPLDLIVKAVDFVNPFNLPNTIGTLFYGTREEKADIGGGIIPADIKTITTTTTTTGKTTTTGVDTTIQTFQEKLNEQIDTWKQESPEQKQFWEEATLGTTDIKLPEIPNPFEGIGEIGNIVKWALIGGGVLLGLYIVSEFVGGNKK